MLCDSTKFLRRMDMPRSGALPGSFCPRQCGDPAFRPPAISTITTMNIADRQPWKFFLHQFISSLVFLPSTLLLPYLHRLRRTWRKMARLTQGFRSSSQSTLSLRNTAVAGLSTNSNTKKTTSHPNIATISYSSTAPWITSIPFLISPTEILTTGRHGRRSATSPSWHSVRSWPRSRPQLYKALSSTFRWTLV